MFLVGLTGGIASGKSTVARMLQDLGCALIDADLVAREIVEPGEKAWKKIRDAFGLEVFHPDGSLNRERLGQIVFADEERRKLLNAITHPQIQKHMMRKVIACFFRGEQFTVLDIPLLFESGKMVPYMTFTIVVSCDQETQLQRLVQRNNYTAEESQQRIKAQMPLVEKCSKATHIIDNSGTLKETRKQVEDLYQELCACKAHLKFRWIAVVVLSGVVAVISVVTRFVYSFW